MQVTVTAQDSLIPDLMRRVRGMDASRRRDAMEAVGLGLASMAKRSFATNPALRPAPWKPKKDGTPSTLQKSTRLRQSITLTFLSSDGVGIGSDAAYAGVHQMGKRTKPHIIRPRSMQALKIPGMGVFRMVKHPGSDIPARPYLPFHPDGRPTAQADRLIRTVLREKLGLTDEGDSSGRRS